MIFLLLSAVSASLLASRCDQDCDWDEFCCDRLPNSLIWMPEGPPLMRPFLADPRRIAMSVAWRRDDDLFHENLGPISFGNQLDFMRWCRPCGLPGEFQWGIEGAIWAIFEHTEYSAPLVNADYYVAFPFTYALGPWRFRFRAYHISSHIGDEFLLYNPGFDRKNASFEFLDFFVTYQRGEWWRLYGGLGVIARSDEEFRCKKFYAEYGLDFVMPWLMTCWPESRLIGQPFFGMHYRTRAENDYKFDGWYVLGYQLGKQCGLERRARLFLEYHSGYSADGQFCKEQTNYWSLNLSYGY